MINIESSECTQHFIFGAAVSAAYIYFIVSFINVQGHAGNSSEGLWHKKKKTNVFLYLGSFSEMLDHINIY